MRLILVLGVSLLAISPAWAVRAPDPGRADRRMTTAPYDAGQIYPLRLAVGRTMAVVVSDQETVTDAWGSDSADVKVEPSDNLLLLKAIREIPAQSLYVKTVAKADGRVALYAFQVSVGPADPSDTYPYTLRFTYPQREAAERATAAQATRERARLQGVNAALSYAPSTEANVRYVLRGETKADFDLLPTWEVTDDNTATHFHFPGNMRVPVIYVVNPDGKEAVCDYTFDSNTGIATVHQLAREFRLRDGDTLLTVYNRAYDPIGTRAATGTRNPAVVRVLKEAVP